MKLLGTGFSIEVRSGVCAKLRSTSNEAPKADSYIHLLRPMTLHCVGCIHNCTIHTSKIGAHGSFFIL